MPAVVLANEEIEVYYYDPENIRYKGVSMQPLLILILIQLITENFPISSSGHVALFEQMFTIYAPQDLVRSLHDSLARHAPYLDGLMHLPTILVYAIVFYKQWILYLKHPLRCRVPLLRLVTVVVIVDVITALSYFVLRVQTFGTPLWLGFAVTSGALASVPYARRQSASRITLLKAVVLAVVQSLALLPGFSRMGLTCVSAMWLGLSARRAMQLSCALQVPLLAGAFVRSLLKVDSLLITEHILNLSSALSILSAILISCYCIRITIKTVQQYKWSIFSVYTALIAVLSFIVRR